jgi:fumarate reductase flavoprotein subunit
MLKDSYDVIIVGGGGSGLAAAVSAVENSSEVLLLEKQPELGGATGIAVGSLTANSTQMQIDAGITDSLEAHAEDAGKFAAPEIEATNNAELRCWFLSHSADTLAWLQDMGLQFFGPNPEPPNRVPRMHNVVPGAKAYITALHARLTRLGGEVLTSAPVVDLIKENERIRGVIAEINGEAREITARKGVVLAAGDYANAPALITRFKGDRFAEIEGIYERAHGDGHILAQRAGAQLINMEITYGPELRFIPPKTKTFQQLLPTSGPLTRIMGALVPIVPQFLMNMIIRRLLVTWQHPEDSLFEDGAILINAHGERFCDERLSPEREIAIANQPGKSAYILLDQRLIEGYSKWPKFISTAPKIGYAYVKDYLKLRPDIAVQGDRLDKICEKRGIPLETVKNTLASNNAEKVKEGLPTLERAPWLLLGPAKAYFTTTEGGAAINKKFQALDENGAPILGLYAIGQNGLGGQILWGHGLHICWAITSGRLVGRQLASE